MKAMQDDTRMSVACNPASQSMAYHRVLGESCGACVRCNSMIRLSRCVLPCTFLCAGPAMSQNVGTTCPIRCWSYRTLLSPQNGGELHGGVSIEQLICRTSGHHWYGGERQRPRLAVDTPPTQSVSTPLTDGPSNES